MAKRSGGGGGQQTKVIERRVGPAEEKDDPKLADWEQAERKGVEVYNEFYPVAAVICTVVGFMVAGIYWLGRGFEVW